MKYYWTGDTAPKPAAWPYKKEIPATFRPFAIQVEFRFCRTWLVRRSDSGILTATGSWIPETKSWRDGKAFIGYAVPDKLKQPLGGGEK